MKLELLKYLNSFFLLKYIQKLIFFSFSKALSNI